MMPNLDSSERFDDLDMLDASLHDARALDTETLSSQEDAVVIIEEFRIREITGPWVSLDRQFVADRLIEIIENPREIKQEGLNLCGPATFFNMAIGRDPVAVATCATALFDSGVGHLGELRIAPGREILTADYAAMSQRGRIAQQAEWMLLGALRNSMSVFWQPSWKGDPNQELAGLTRPEEMTDWMIRSGIWPKVKNEGNWVTPKGIPHALTLMTAPGTDIALLINMNMIAESISAFSVNPDHSFLLESFPNHWVILLGDPNNDISQENVILSLWSWGITSPVMIRKEIFIDNYYGAIVGHMP